jgi:uncharacterized protein (UPF0335 family)
MSSVEVVLNGTAREELKSFIGRIERLEEDKAAVGTDLKEVYAEAKSSGFDTKALRKLIARRRKDARELEMEEGILSCYMDAIEGKSVDTKANLSHTVTQNTAAPASTA